MRSKTIVRFGGLYILGLLVIGVGSSASAAQDPPEVTGFIAGHFGYAGSATYDDAVRSLMKFGWIVDAPGPPSPTPSVYPISARLVGRFADNGLTATNSSLLKSGWRVDKAPRNIVQDTTVDFSAILLTSNPSAGCIPKALPADCPR